MTTTVAFIGLGNMGGSMAANLVKAGFAVQAFDVSPNNLQAASDAGCLATTSATEAVSGADYVVSMLPNGQIVEQVYIGEAPLLDAIAQTSLVIDCSTIAPINAQRVGKQAEQRDIRFIDAPVSGGVAAAAAGSLAFMVGGTERAFEDARPVLSAMGANLFRAGEVGAGQVAKICNNLLLAVHMAGTSEALQLGIDNGLDPAVLSEIMLKSSGSNWSLEKYNPVPGVMQNAPASNDYQGGFMLDLMLKDLGLANQAATASQSSIPMGAAARNLFNLRKHQGGKDNGDNDFSSIYRLYQK